VEQFNRMTPGPHLTGEEVDELGSVAQQLKTVDAAVRLLNPGERVLGISSIPYGSTRGSLWLTDRALHWLPISRWGKTVSVPLAETASANYEIGSAMSRLQVFLPSGRRLEFGPGTAIVVAQELERLLGPRCQTVRKGLSR
jgi:hypothetical protein